MVFPLGPEEQSLEADVQEVGFRPPRARYAVEVGREDAQDSRRADEAQTARLRHTDGEIGEGGAAHLCMYWASLAGIL